MRNCQGSVGVMSYNGFHHFNTEKKIDLVEQQYCILNSLNLTSGVMATLLCLV